MSVFSSSKEKQTANVNVVPEWDIHYPHSHYRCPHYLQNVKTESNSFPNRKELVNGVSYAGVPV